MSRSAATSYHREHCSRLVRSDLHHLAGRAHRRSAARGKFMEIADWRSKIDELDEQIVRLLNQRAAAAVEIGRLKRKSGAAIYEPNREQSVYQHVATVNPGPLTAGQLQDIYYRVMDVMRSLQRVESGASSGDSEGAPQLPAGQGSTGLR